MKIIFLNTWDGKLKVKIKNFIKENLPSTDIFCFQEVYEEMKSLCHKLLESYQEFSAYKQVNEKDNFSQGTYIKKTLVVKSTQILLQDEPNLGLGINAAIKMDGKRINIGNFHGLSRPGDKLDNPERLEQSKLLIKSYQEISGPKIIGGDFNLEAGTESVQMFEKEGYRNLIKEFTISTTKNKYVWEKYPSHKQYFADFVFVSPEVKVVDFSVPNLEISDHLPLILEIKI